MSEQDCWLVCCHSFLQIRDALEEAEKIANETGKTHFIIAESYHGEPAIYTIHKGDISSEYPSLVLYEKVEPKIKEEEE